MQEGQNKAMLIKHMQYGNPDWLGEERCSHVKRTSGHKDKTNRLQTHSQ